MNVLEYIIEEVHSEKDLNNGYVKVDITVNCWGCIERKTRTFMKDTWEYLKAEGHFYE